MKMASKLAKKVKKAKKSKKGKVGSKAKRFKKIEKRVSVLLYVGIAAIAPPLIIACLCWGISACQG